MTQICRHVSQEPYWGEKKQKQYQLVIPGPQIAACDQAGANSKGHPIGMRDVGQILVGATPRHSAMLPQRTDGNLDVWDLSAGTILYLPVEVAGGLPPMATRMRRKVVASWRAGGMICPQWTLTSYAACARMS